jgi:glutaredoxin 2
MPFGLKKIDYELVTLLNDDVDTPTDLIGAKMVPILKKNDGSVMAESLEIVRYLDESCGDGAALAESANRQDLQNWMDNAGLNPLTMPRWVQAPLLEFATPGSGAYFTEKKEAGIGPFREHLDNSAALKSELNGKLQTLGTLIKAPDAVNGELSYDDILLFGHLRGITIIGGLDYPATVRDYLDTMSGQSGVPLYDAIAID